MFMIGFTVKGSCVTNKNIKEILKILGKFFYVKMFEDKKFQMIVHGKKSGFRHIGLCYVKGSIEEQENGCKIEYTVFPEFICAILLILYLFVCLYKIYLDMARRSGGALGWGTVLGIIIMILPIIVIALESRSQQNVCKERLQYLLSEGRTIMML